MAEKYIIGIDEVGRGPLAGPVAVGVIVIEKTEYLKIQAEEIFPAHKDSKKLTPKKRDLYFDKINELKGAGRLRFGIFFENNEVIDKYGIAQAIRFAVEKSFKKLACSPDETLVLLDGGLKAPKEFKNQQSIIRGDESELVIALASIAAKVTRDRLMVQLAEKYPVYGLEKHKGYGTKAHLESLHKHGYSDIHRRSFLKHFELKPAGGN